MPEVLTRDRRYEAAQSGRHGIGTVAGFTSEWWPTSNRNGGRHHVGIRNMTAAKLVLERISPKPRGRPVAWEDAPVDIDITTPAGRAEMLAAIVVASIAGEISPEDAQSLGAGLEIIRRNEEHQRLLKDIEAIKARLGIDHDV